MTMIFVGLILLLALYFVGAEEGATSSSRVCMCMNLCMTDAT